MRRIALILFLLLALLENAIGAPRNVILLIGDGMGIAHITAARITKGGPSSRLAIDGLPVAGLVTTYCANALITDSAAAATAIATGTKANYGVVGLAPDGSRAKSILEAAQEIGKSTGLVTTTSITDATPACFASHVENRGQQQEIAAQLIAAKVDVLCGGGLGYFTPKGKDGSWREDDRDLTAEAVLGGYKLSVNEADLKSTTGPKILGLFAQGNLSTQSPEPPLSELADKAIQTLSRNRHGFFLMVEGGQIDIYSHHNDFDGMVRQLLEFDRVVAEALDFARRDGNTLVIVTADHETGGLTLLKDDKGKLSPSWSTTGHSGVVVPIFAFGPDSQRFAGVIDNTNISKTIAALWHVNIGVQKQAAVVK